MDLQTLIFLNETEKNGTHEEETGKFFMLATTKSCNIQLL